MILAAIGEHYSFSLAELRGLTAAEARFWHNAAAALHAERKPKAP